MSAQTAKYRPLNSGSRTVNVAKNIVVGYVCSIISMVLHFISRTIFIGTLGVTFLGINGLFSSIIGVLTLTELGIGTAMNFSLYKPVAENDLEKVKSLMMFYRKAYVVIAVVISIIGLMLIPLLPLLVKGAESIDDAWIYYCVFLFNTVSTYFVSYKYSLVAAEQKGYLLNAINSVCNVIIIILQCISLVCFKDYLIYLTVLAFAQLMQKICINIYLNKRYPYLRERNVQKLDAGELNTIKKNVSALVVHKVGEISVTQSNNIVTSLFLGVALVGILSNYLLVISSVNLFISIIINGAISSMGNLVAVASKDKQLEVLNTYNFVAFALYGFTTVCYWGLFTPFIELWIGKENTIEPTVLFLIITAQYLYGQRMTINNIKHASGVFAEDKYVSLIQGAINLLVSISLVNIIGLPGVFLGTVISGLFVNIIRPIIVYRKMFHTSAVSYFIPFACRLIFVITAAVGIKLCSDMLIKETTWISFSLRIILTCTAYGIIFLIFYGHSREFKDVIQRFMQSRKVLVRREKRPT